LEEYITFIIFTSIV